MTFWFDFLRKEFERVFAEYVQLPRLILTAALYPNPDQKGKNAEDELYDWSGDLADSSWKSGGEQISAYDIEKNKMKVLGESGYNISEESLKSIKDSRSMFRERMKEIEASVSGVKPIGRTFGLPSTTRGYDFRSVAGKRHKDMLGSLRWQNRLFGD